MKSAQRTATASKEDVAVFRRFNRMYTRYIGTLNEVWLDSDYSLPEARVLYEVATRVAPKAKAVADDLAMDPGYLSRLLGKLERAGLLKRKASLHDGRSAEIALTPRGRAVFKKLDALSEREAQSLLEAMPAAARMQLMGSVQTMERLLAKDSGNLPPYILRPHRVGDMGWIVHQEGLGYAQEFGWDGTFEAFVARIVDDFITHFDSRRERCWIAEVDGQNVGHIFLVKHPDEPDTAKLRLLWVEPHARGTGLGHVLVKECISFARSAGYRKVTLWTQSSLKAAHRIYEKAGFRLVKAEPHHSFDKDLVGQVWELNLI